MNLSDYFENTKGFGVLATANSDGAVDVAVYARPHVLDDGTVAFIMRDRLSHENLQSNPQAAYLFREGATGYAGKRLYLTKLREETDPDAIAALRRRCVADDATGDAESRFLVVFQVDSVRPLVGDAE